MYNDQPDSVKIRTMYMTNYLTQLTYICTIGITIILSSCKKEQVQIQQEEPNYTIKEPSAYFPAYPGSFWVYSNSDTLKVLPQYEKYDYNVHAYPFITEHLLLPKLILNGVYNNGDSYAYVNGYKISKASTYSTYPDPMRAILSELEGEQINLGYSDNPNYHYHHAIRTLKVDTTLQIGLTEFQNVLITAQFNVGCVEEGPGIGPCTYLREYYAKDIGLIKRESKTNFSDTVFTEEFVITDYFINN